MSISLVHENFSILFVCVYGVCVCTRLRVYVSLYICASVQCPKDNPQCHSTGTFPTVFESGSLSGLELAEKAELPGRQIPRI